MKDTKRKMIDKLMSGSIAGGISGSTAGSVPRKVKKSGAYKRPKVQTLSQIKKSRKY